MSHDKRFSRSERALIALGIVVPTAFLGAVVWDKKLNDVPSFVAPAQSIPSPNALDTLHTAFGQRVVSLGAENQPDFVTYEPGKVDYKAEKAISEPLEKRQKLLAANEKALSTVRVALGQPYGKFLTYDVNQKFPEYAENRSLARLLAFAARTQADTGKFPQAADTALDGVALGVQIVGDGSLDARFGEACEAIARKPLWEISERLDAKTARAALARLESLDARRRSIVRGFDTENFLLHQLLADLGPSPALFVQAIGYDPKDLSSWEMRMTLLKIRLTDKRAVLEANRKYHEAVAARLSQPYSRNSFPPAPSDAINQLLAIDPSGFAFTDARNRTDTELLKAVVALQAYKLEKGNYPANLDELVSGGYLKAVPADAFGLEKPLRYRRDGAKYALWSVGPDGEDDGGKALGGDKPRNVQAESVGDIVVRINTY